MSNVAHVMQAGNDFLPNVPSIDIYDKPTGLDLLFVAYKHLLPELGGHLTAGGVINRSRLVQLLVFLARDEEAAYKRRAVSTAATASSHTNKACCFCRICCQLLAKGTVVVHCQH